MFCLSIIEYLICVLINNIGFNWDPLITFGIIFTVVQIFLTFENLTNYINEPICNLNRRLDHLNKEFEQQRNKLLHENELKTIELDRKLYLLQKEFEQEKKKLLRESELTINNLYRKVSLLNTVLDTKQPFKVVAKMVTDYKMVVFDKSVKYLEYKRNPAPKAADEVKALKKISDKILREAKEIEYKYDYILQAFPAIEEFVQNDEDLISVAEHLSLSELDELRDKRRDYLSDEEYRNLSEDERSQLALDRYIRNTKKDKWAIGRDYEMSCAFQLKQQGFKVELNGIKYKYADLGRDLIAVKMDVTQRQKFYIIQCKNWSKERTIHENVIMQLYGTTVEYQLSYNITDNNDIIPMLVIPPYSKLSDVAVKCAERLNVRILRLPNIEFPRIKCNINNGNKIYHLPFDQQYDRTEISLPGEFYAYTVADATSKGFRRAMRHIFS